jgi:MFS transporter, DHA3 family, tetracycline resistance protein
MWNMLRGGLGLVSRSSLLRWFLIAGIAFGACEEAFDRLGDAHFLLDYHFPPLADFKPVIWFGIIAGGVRIVSFIATGAASRWLNMMESTAMGWALFLVSLVRMGCIVIFGLAGNFFLALGA